jgi:hypothetical protein
MSAASVPRANDGPDFAAAAAARRAPMTVRRSLRAALGDFYRQSWRLLLLNTALSLMVLAILAAALVAPVALGLLVLAGPAAAALMHCAVVLAQTEDLRLRDAATGLRLHWRRGLVLATLLAGAALLGSVAIAFYGGAGALAWPLAALVTYSLALVALFQLAVWPVAVFERERALGDVLRLAAYTLLRRPIGFAALGLVLFLLNALGAAAALVPFLTLTIAYSFLAAAHYALPRSPLREGGS